MVLARCDQLVHEDSQSHKCRGGITADAIGWLKLWARIDVGESGEGVSVQETLMKIQARTSKHKEQEQVSRTKNQMMLNTQDLPCFGALEEGKTPTEALAYSLIMWRSQVQRCSLSCMEEQWCSSLEEEEH